MAIQDTGQIKLTDIQYEFEGEYFDSNDTPIQRSHYSFSRYKGKNGIASSGPVRASDFYGKFTVKSLSFETDTIAIKDYDPASPYLVNVENGQDQVIVNRSHDVGSYSAEVIWTDDNDTRWKDNNGNPLNSNQSFSFDDSAEVSSKKKSINIFHKGSLTPDASPTAIGQLQLQTEPTGTWKPGEWVQGANATLAISLNDNDYPVDTASLSSLSRYTYHIFSNGYIAALYNSYSNLDKSSFSTTCVNVYQVSSTSSGFAVPSYVSSGTIDRTHRFYDSFYGRETNYYPAWDRNAAVVSEDGSKIYMVSAKPDANGTDRAAWMTMAYITITVSSSGNPSVSITNISGSSLDWNSGNLGASYASSNWVGSGANAPSVYGFIKQYNSSRYWLWGINAKGVTTTRSFADYTTGVDYITNNITNNTIPSNGIELGFDRFYHA